MLQKETYITEREVKSCEDSINSAAEYAGVKLEPRQLGGSVLRMLVGGPPFPSDQRAVLPFLREDQLPQFQRRYPQLFLNSDQQT